MNPKQILKSILPQSLIENLKSQKENLFFTSLESAAQEQNLNELARELSQIVPDISKQYTTFDIDTPYLELKVRTLHAFQVSLVQKAIESLGGSEHIKTIVDIGDSSGTHLKYIQGLFDSIRGIGVNLDIEAIQKIQAKGLEAIHSRAEELDQHDIEADLFLSFETMEHLHDPAHFLRSLSEKTECKGFVVTIPYLAQSRVGLHHIRNQQEREVFAENTHVFELSPSDWKLLFQHAGWKVEYDQIFLQYPKKHWLRATKMMWRQSDFEGFYGAILTRDSKWSQCYKDW